LLQKSIVLTPREFKFETQSRLQAKQLRRDIDELAKHTKAKVNRKAGKVPG
tara:strand:+ start:755 stop:907 length:153 start_codon:yes stop_codon:yes gene_type:complete